MSVNRYVAIVQRVVELQEAEAERAGRESESEPGGPASERAVTAAIAARGSIHPSYLDFLGVHDGWRHVDYGTILFSAGELASEDYACVEETLGYDEESPAEVTQALIIGFNENSAALVLLLASGEVVEHRYEEEERHADLCAYFMCRVERLIAWRARAEAALARTQSEWTVSWRRARAVELSEALRSRMAGPRTPAPIDPAPTGDSATVAADLVARDSAGEVLAAVDLGLLLYLNACPSPSEVVACLEAFRRHFPVDGLEWMQAHHYGFLTEPLPNPLPEGFAETLTVDDTGWFGIRATSGDTLPQHVLNVRGIPPDGEEDSQQRASFVEVLVPADASPDALRALTLELVAVLPVVCGCGGWFARAHDDEGWDAIYRWCRSHLAVEASNVDGWLEGALHSHTGASWLTVLGAPYVDVLGKLDLPGSVEVREVGPHRVLTAGELTLGATFPHAIAAVARLLEPVLLVDWSKHGMISMGGVLFSTHAQQLPGAFGDHHATAAYRRRLLDPQSFVGPSALERTLGAVQVLRGRMGAADVKRWVEQADPAEIDSLETGLASLFAGCCVVGGVAAIEALAFATEFGTTAPTGVFGNLLHEYLAAGRLDEALALVPAAIQIAVADARPATLHNAACVLVGDGQHDEAVRCLSLLAKADYDMATVRQDSDFAPLHGRADWQTLIG